MSKDTRPYITVANELFGHPKFKKLSPPARLYVLELWAHCNQYMTDGYVDRETFQARGKNVAEQMVETGWAYSLEDGGYAMHDYLEHQKSRVEIEQFKKKKRDAGIQSNHNRNHKDGRGHDPLCPHCQTTK